MYHLNLQRRLSPSRRDDSVDWSAAVRDAQSAVQSGNALATQYEQLSSAIKVFVADAKAQAAQLLEQLNTFRDAAAAQAEAYENLDTLAFGEDDVPQEFSDLFDDVSTGDYDSEIDDLETPLMEIVG